MIFLLIHIFSSFIVQQDKSLNGLWFYQEKDDYKEILIYDEHIFFINQTFGIRYNKYFVQQDSLYITAGGGEVMYINRFLKIDSCSLNIFTDSEPIRLKKLAAINTWTKTAIMSNDFEFWQNFLSYYRNRRSKYIHSMENGQ